MVLQLKPDLCLVSLPVNIISQKYDRNSFEFNFGILMTQQCFNQLENRMMVEQILRKMAYYLTGSELEHEMLSRQKTEFMQPMMEKLMKKMMGLTDSADVETMLKTIIGQPDSMANQ